MNCIIVVKEYSQIGKVRFYTGQLEHEEENETDKFLTRYENDNAFNRDIQLIMQALRNIGMRGALERYFRLEKGFSALPIDTCQLRLICWRLSDEVVVLLGGGEKVSQKAQDCPEIFPQFDLMDQIVRQYKSRKRLNEAFVYRGKLEGDWVFEVDLKLMEDGKDEKAK